MHERRCLVCTFLVYVMMTATVNLTEIFRFFLFAFLFSFFINSSILHFCTEGVNKLLLERVIVETLEWAHWIGNNIF